MNIKNIQNVCKWYLYQYISSFIHNQRYYEFRKKQDIGVLTQVKAMELYDKIEFPIENVLSIRTSVSAFALISGKKFRTRQINDRRAVEVTRIF